MNWKKHWQIKGTATHLKLQAHTTKDKTCLLLSDALASKYIQVVHFNQCRTQMTIWQSMTWIIELQDLFPGQPGKPKRVCYLNYISQYFGNRIFLYSKSSLSSCFPLSAKIAYIQDSYCVTTLWWRWLHQRHCRGFSGSWRSQMQWFWGSSPRRTCWWRRCCRSPEH